MPLNSGDQLAHYRLVGPIGEGGMGVVWKAHDSRLERTVALKLLRESVAADPALLARFETEARALATFSHPNIVTIYSIEESEGVRFLTMEFVEGTPLSRHVPEGGLPLGDFFALAVPLVDALRTAHGHGVMHRDLKPGNVLVTAAGEPKILDFGIAKLLRDVRAADRRTLSDTSGIVGTPGFMSPEQALGRRLDPRSDLFSLGAVLYFMIAGREPFAGDTVAEVMASLLRDPPTPLAAARSDAPESLVTTIERCLAKEPAERYQTADQVLVALSQVRDAAVGAERTVRSIAVLPFDDLSPERDQDYFCEGIAEEITIALTRIKELKVASRSSAFLARATIRDRGRVGEHLGVETLLEGSVRKAGSRLRISVELTDLASGYHLWTERYDREMQDIFAIQDEIASSVADALRGQLTHREKRAMHHSPTPQVQAYDLYLRGRKFYYQYSRRGMEFALQMYRRALEVDPEYARAHAGVAACHAFLYFYSGRRPEDRDLADAASTRAVELAPESAEAHAARGVALTLRDEFPAAEKEFTEAIRLNPDLFDAHYFYARGCFAQGRLDDAVRLWEKASELRPDDYQSPLLVAQAYEHLHRAQDAERSRRRGIAIAEQQLALHPDDVRALYMGANGLVALGNREKGLDWASRAVALDPDDAMLQYNIGCIYSRAGMSERALDCLERAVAGGLQQKEWFQQDTDLDPLRAHPRFIALMSSLAAAPV